MQRTLKFAHAGNGFRITPPVARRACRALNEILGTTYPPSSYRDVEFAGGDALLFHHTNGSGAYRVRLQCDCSGGYQTYTAWDNRFQPILDAMGL